MPSLLFLKIKNIFNYGLICCSLLFSTTVFAHPHSWVDTNTYIHSNDTHITSLYMTWAFDAETSSYMLQGEDMSLGEKEKTLQRLAEGVVNNMYNEHYFTYFYLLDTPVRYKKARYPQLIQEQDKLILSFEIPLSEPIKFANNTFKLFIYDSTYYVDMSWLNDSEIKLSQPLNEHCTGRVIAPDVSQELRDFTLTLAEDVAPNNELGEHFSQQFKLTCQ